MMRRYILGVLLCAAYYTSLCADVVSEFIQIRRAREHDLPAALELDRSVTFEFFKPLYVTYYAHLPHGKNADHFLLCELDADKQNFPKCLDDTSSRRLLVAEDMRTNTLVGLLLFHREHGIMELDLLLVDQQYRRKGIGRRLVREALTIFDSITACIVYPLRFGNENQLAFYGSLGFMCEKQVPHEKHDVYGIDYAETRYFYRMCNNKDSALHH